MPTAFTRGEILSRLNAKRREGKAILLFGAGSGFSAKCAEKGGADIIGVYSGSINRMRGLPPIVERLGYCDCNRLVWEQARFILPVIQHTPCIAGVGAHDPLISLDQYLNDLIGLGFSGVVNEPFAGGVGRRGAAALERAGFGFSREMELIERAHKKDMLTIAWCFDGGQAERMAEAGADIIGAMALFGPDGEHHPENFDEALAVAGEICAAAKAARPDVLVLTHGPAFMTVDEARRSIQLSGADGYASGSSGERIPAEKAVVGVTRGFSSIEIQ